MVVEEIVLNDDKPRRGRYSGSCISSNRSAATCASHCFKGSALGDGMD